MTSEELKVIMDTLRLTRLNEAKYAPRRATAAPRTTVAPAVDPVKIGEEARAYADAEFAAGREITATDAVHHIMESRGAQV